MRSLSIVLPVLVLCGCATSTQQSAPRIVTTTISAPRQLYANEPPTLPVVQATIEQDISLNDQHDFSRFWIDVPICENGIDRCVPSVGVVTLIQRIDEASKDGLIDVSIDLSNRANIELGMGNAKFSVYRSVGTDTNHVSYGAVGKRMTFSLQPGAESSMNLPHGISLSVQVKKTGGQPMS